MSWRLDALKTAHKKHGRDYLRRLRRATRPAEPPPRYRRYPPMLKTTPRGLAITAMVVLLITVLVVLVDADAANKRAVKAAVCEVFGSRCAGALRVARCETGGTLDPRARGSAGERGLFQIHPIHWGWINENRLFQPAYNARVAWRLSRGGTNWTHWTCRP